MSHNKRMTTNGVVNFPILIFKSSNIILGYLYCPEICRYIHILMPMEEVKNHGCIQDCSIMLFCACVVHTMHMKRGKGFQLHSCNSYLKGFFNLPNALVGNGCVYTPTSSDAFFSNHFWQAHSPLLLKKINIQIRFWSTRNREHNALLYCCRVHAKYSV